MSGREWKPGDVAMVEHHDAKPEVVAIRSVGLGVGMPCWETGRGYLVDSRVDSVRPLVVIDPEDREQVERMLNAYYSRESESNWGGLFDQMQQALREFANPQPPKPDEPTGLGAVVEDADGQRWVRVEPTAGAQEVHAWRNRIPQAEPRTVQWNKVAAVRVLSSGVDQ